LAKEYNRFYADLPIFLENNEAILAFRIALSDLTAQTIKKGMSLLGISVPDRM
jgi:arginyl-tRNA synthetase